MNFEVEKNIIYCLRKSIECCDRAMHNLQFVLESENEITHQDLFNCQNDEIRLIDSDWLEFAKCYLYYYCNTICFIDEGANI